MGGDSPLLFRYKGLPLTGLFTIRTLDLDLQISPNPTADILTISFENDQTNDYLLLLNDVEGQLLRRIEAANTASFRETLDLSDLPAGVYTLTVSCKEGAASRPVIKR